ncbi:hypothetical protein [Acinetobacter sp. ANC 5502]
MGNKCKSCKNGFNGQNGNGYHPCGCKNVRSTHIRQDKELSIQFKTFAEKCKDLSKAMNSNRDRCKIIPVDNFEFYPLDARLKMIETLNQVVNSGDMNLKHVQEAAKKLEKLIKLL